MKKSILLLSIIFLAISCKKKENGAPKVQGCTNYTATNYNSSANEDDGSCIFPTKAVIKYVQIISHPNVNDNGLPWDSDGTEADLLIRIKQNGNILYQTTDNNGVGVPFLWSVDPNITINNVDYSDYLTIYLYDNDGSVAEYMGLTTIDLSNYTHVGDNTYPYSIESTYSGYTFKLSVDWE